MTELNCNFAQTAPQNMTQNAVSQALRQLMTDCDIDTFKALSLRSQVSLGAIKRLQQGHILTMQVQTVRKIAEVLQISVDDLVRSLTTESIPIPKPNASNSELQQEYDRLAQKLKHQATTCRETFQQEALQTLEPWLIQWSAAAHAAQTNPQLMANKLLPLLSPIDRLLMEWGVSPIGTIGEECDYDPALHHGMNGDFQLGDRIRIRFLGYRYQNSTGNHVLHRAKVMRLDSL